ENIIVRWEDTVMLDIEALQIINWRSLTQDRDGWRTAINRNVQTKAVHNNIKEIVFEYKQRAVKRKAKERAEAQRVVQRKVIELLMKDNHNHYKCPGCVKKYKPQGITNHVKACIKARDWCKKNKIG
ncbi:unnamed protein product, partial [Rotaria sp. Silwood2]